MTERRKQFMPDKLRKREPWASINFYTVLLCLWYLFRLLLLKVPASPVHQVDGAEAEQRIHACCLSNAFFHLPDTMSTDTQVKELLPFLLHPSPQVVSLAVVNLLPFTVSSSPQRRLFLDEKAGPDNKGWLRVFAAAARSSHEPVRPHIHLDGWA